MKKVLLTVTLVALFGVANAQTDEGGWLIGASSSFGFSSTSFDGGGDNLSSFDFDVTAGYFLIDNLAAGLNFGLASSKQGDSKSSTSLIGPFARYYVNGTFFVVASYSAATTKFDPGTGEMKNNFSILGLEAGYPIWIVDNVAIEPSLNYGIASGDDIINSNTFGLNVGFNLYF